MAQETSLATSSIKPKRLTQITKIVQLSNLDSFQ